MRSVSNTARGHWRSFRVVSIAICIDSRSFSTREWAEISGWWRRISHQARHAAAAAESTPVSAKDWPAEKALRTARSRARAVSPAMVVDQTSVARRDTSWRLRYQLRCSISRSRT